MKQIKHIISEDATLHNALQRLNDLSGGAMTLFACDRDGRVTGTLTDGDVRRALLGGTQLDAPVSEAMHRSFRSVQANAAPTPQTVRAIAAMRSAGVRLLPRLDAEGRLVDVLNLATTHTQLPVSAVLMAGGQGERLRPLTLTVPKPLVEVDGKPIIDYNIEALAACGVTDITVITRYLAQQLHSHFAQPVAGVQVKCALEDGPALGTIGGATLAALPSEGTTLVMNSDILTTLSFEDMYLHHTDTGAAITIAAIPYKVSVPYAILTCGDDGAVHGIAEKPVYSHLANGGIYLIENRVLQTLQPGVRCDATDLIERCIAAGERVSWHVVDGTWIDIGSPADLARAKSLMQHYRHLAKR